jgi:hypothetical protein
MIIAGDGQPNAGVPQGGSRWLFLEHFLKLCARIHTSAKKQASSSSHGVSHIPAQVEQAGQQENSTDPRNRRL